MTITRIAQPGRTRLILAAAIVAVAGLVILLSQIASARTAEAAAAGDGPKPSIVHHLSAASAQANSRSSIGCRPEWTR